MSAERAKAIGEEVEYAVVSADELEHVGDGEADWFDARQPDGTPVEVKSCAFRIPDQGNSRRGRILIKRAAHEKLLEAGGRYRIAVRDEDVEILVSVDVPAERVDEEISSWIDAKGRSYEYAQLPWSAVIPSEEVANGD